MLNKSILQILAIPAKFLLFPLIEMFSKVGRQEAADAVVRQKHVKVAQKATFGFMRLVLFLQGLEGDDLSETHNSVIVRSKTGV